MRAASFKPTAPLLVAALLAVLHLSFSLGVNPPGYLTYDSGTYHFMAKTFAETGGFTVWNGYEEFPSESLKVAQLRIQDNRLVAQYPELLTVVATPLYLLFGYPGLFLLQSLAFLGNLWLLFLLAQRLFRDPLVSWLALGVYAFATFAWEYSQSSYPHLIATFCVLAAYTLLAHALPWSAEGPTATSEQPSSSRLLWLCFGAGLAAGCAPGMRLDGIFAWPGLFIPFLFLRPFRWGMVSALTAGLVPGLLFLSFTNLQKFGVFFPLHYGESRANHYTSDLTFYLPILGTLAVGALALAVLQRLDGAIQRRLLLAGAAALALAAVVVPALQQAVLRLADGAWQILVDLRVRPVSPEPGLSRSPGGAMIYIGGVKKALLQSCPYLVLTLVALVDAVRQRRSLAQLGFLCAAPATFIAFFSYLAWHGSVALNMRYLNPALPFLALLTGWMLAPRLRAVSARFAGFTWLASLLSLWVIFRFHDFTMLDQEIWLLTAPLALAATLLVLELLRRTPVLPTLGDRLVTYLLLFALAWSGAVTFARDYPASARVRGINLMVGQAFGDLVEGDSLVLTDFADFTWHLLDRHDKVRISYMSEDREAMEALVNHHLEAGRKVYVAGSAYGARGAVQSGYLQNFRVQLIHTWDLGGLPSVALLGLELKASNGPLGS